MKKMLLEDKNTYSFGHKRHSFGHNLDRDLNRKNSLTKVIQLYIVNKEMLSKDGKLHS